jgi:predicted nuclease of predicted toxin-antitoxin system
MAKISFYFDEMMNRPAATELDRRGYIVIMANDVEMTQKKDEEHLRYATEHGMVLVTQDRKFAGLALKQTDHTGVVCWTEDLQNIGAIVHALSRFAEEHTPEEVAGQVFWLK